MSITLTLIKFTKKFFREHQTHLQKCYPGITENRLIQELTYYQPNSYATFADFLESIFVPSNTDSPINIFFNKLKLGIPLAYISGKSFFYRSNFEITPAVLIPRFETEGLVELALSDLRSNLQLMELKDHRPIRIMDIGTGSGIIAITLALELSDFFKSSSFSLKEEVPFVEIIATDISPAALELAQKNYFSHQHSINHLISFKFLIMDRLQNFKTMESNSKVDLIVSNPPYIKSSEDYAEVHEGVKKFEPDLALFLPDNEYINWYNTFFNDAYQILDKKGTMFLEGHERHLLSLKILGSGVGFSNQKIFKDLSGRDRFLRLEK